MTLLITKDTGFSYTKFYDVCLSLAMTNAELALIQSSLGHEIISVGGM